MVRSSYLFLGYFLHTLKSLLFSAPIFPSLCVRNKRMSDYLIAAFKYISELNTEREWDIKEDVTISVLMKPNIMWAFQYCFYVSLVIYHTVCFASIGKPITLDNLIITPSSFDVPSSLLFCFLTALTVHFFFYYIQFFIFTHHHCPSLLPFSFSFLLIHSTLLNNQRLVIFFSTFILFSSVIFFSCN